LSQIPVKVEKYERSLAKQCGNQTICQQVAVSLALVRFTKSLWFLQLSKVDGGALEVMLDVHITLSRPFVCHLLLELQKTDVILIRVVEVLFNWAVFQRFFIIWHFVMQIEVL